MPILDMYKKKEKGRVEKKAPMFPFLVYQRDVIYLFDSEHLYFQLDHVPREVWLVF